jgi:hypothetical protein
MKRYSFLWQKGLEFLWAFALVALPITSFPPIVNRLKVVVAPLSALPVAVLLLVWFLPYLLRRGKLPIECVPFLVFLLAVLGVTSGAMFLEIGGLKEKDILGQELGALLTLAIGAAFYFLFATWPQEEQQLQNTLRWLNIGGILLVLWALLQAYLILTSTRYPDWATQIQNWLSDKPPHFRSRGDRITGLAYEASWFAHLIAQCYFPIWLAATYERTSAFRFRVMRLSVENILLPLGAFVFYLSSPRVSLVSFLLLFLFLFIKTNNQLRLRFVGWIANRTSAASGTGAPLARKLLGLSFSVLLVVFYIGAAFGLLHLGSQRDWRLKLITSTPPSQSEIMSVITLNEDSLLNLSQRFAFLERSVYWLAGWNVFNQHPLFGVGLGNAGFFFPEELPSIGWGSFEIRNIIYRSQSLANIKSFWIRLLAETGILGFSIFAAWLYILWRSARLTYQDRRRTMRFIALAGQCALIAWLSEGFSIDTFALPYLWVWLGLISASGFIHRQSVAFNQTAGQNKNATLYQSAAPISPIQSNQGISQNGFSGTC